MIKNRKTESCQYIYIYISHSVYILLRHQVYYQALEGLQYSLNDTDFSQKWTISSWPQKIEKQMEKTLKLLATDNERYQKEMEGEQALFGNQMETLDNAVRNFVTFVDLDQVCWCCPFYQ